MIHMAIGIVGSGHNSVHCYIADTNAKQIELYVYTIYLCVTEFPTQHQMAWINLIEKINYCETA